MLKLFLVIYNLQGALVHVDEMTPVSEKECMEYAAKQTMLNIGRLDVDGYVFNCEWRRAAPVTGGRKT